MRKFSESFQTLLDNLDKAARAVTQSSEIDDREQALAVKDVLCKSTSVINRKHGLTPNSGKYRSKHKLEYAKV